MCSLHPGSRGWERVNDWPDFSSSGTSQWAVELKYADFKKPGESHRLASHKGKA